MITTYFSICLSFHLSTPRTVSLLSSNTFPINEENQSTLDSELQRRFVSANGADEAWIVNC